MRFSFNLFEFLKLGTDKLFTLIVNSNTFNGVYQNSSINTGIGCKYWGICTSICKNATIYNG